MLSTPECFAFSRFILFSTLTFYFRISSFFSTSLPFLRKIFLLLLNPRKKNAPNRNLARIFILLQCFSGFLYILYLLQLFRVYRRHCHVLLSDIRRSLEHQVPAILCLQEQLLFHILQQANCLRQSPFGL